MKTLTTFFITLLVCSLCFMSCDRNEDDNGATTPPTTEGFSWRENSTSAPLNTAGASEVRNQYNSIFAFTGTTATSGTLFEFNLTAVTPGTYQVNSSNLFYFNGNTATPSTGKVVITSNANGKASGTFEATWSSGSVNSVYGTFTDIPVK